MFGQLDNNVQILVYSIIGLHVLAFVIWVALTIPTLFNNKQS
jgi:hypothetical protein